MRNGCIQVFFAALAIIAGTTFAAEEDKPDTSTTVTGVFTIPAGDESLEGMTIVVQLWEYDPFLADAGATLIEKLPIKDVKHAKGEATKVEFKIGAKGTITPRRNYYVTARGYVGDTYVYYGKPGHDDIGRVITEGKPRTIAFAGQRLK